MRTLKERRLHWHLRATYTQRKSYVITRSHAAQLITCRQRSKRRTDMLVDHQNRNTALILQSHHSMIMEARQFHALILERLDRQTTTMVTRSVSETSLIDEDFSSPSTARQLKRVQHGRLRTTLDPVNQKQQRTRKTRWENGSYRSLRVRLSPWFTTRAWEISLNFGITMRTSNLISRDSMIFEACRDGDMREVLALFQTGQASPYDYCQRDKHWPEGMSVLGVRLDRHHTHENCHLIAL